MTKRKDSADPNDSLINGSLERIGAIKHGCDGEKIKHIGIFFVEDNE